MGIKDKQIILNAINLTKGLLADLKKNGIITERQPDKLEASLSDVYINLTRPLIVTLIGTFSSGKTTFINAVIKERILPERIAPCTGMVCKIGYCDSHLKIQYLENGIKIKKEIGIEDLSKFVDIGNPDYRQKEIGDILEIFHKNDFCQKDIVLVDTPGFNDPKFQDDATNMALDKADAVIYCMSAIHAYSKTDVEKINNLHERKIDSVFYVVGFMDILHLNGISTGVNEMDSFKSMMMKNLASQTSLHEDGIFFVSAIDELNKISKKKSILEDNGVENVRIKIWEYLQKNRMPIKINNARNNLNKISIKLEKNIRRVLDENQKKTNLFEEKIALRQRNKNDAQKCIEAIHKSYTEYEEEAHSFVKAQIEAEISSVIDNIDKWVDEVFDYTSIIPLIGFDNEALQKKVNVIQNKCTEKIQKAIEERIIPYISNSTNKLNRSIQHLVEQYIISVNIDNNKIDSSVSLHLAIKQNPLYDNLTPISIMGTIALLEKSTIGITALAFTPMLGVFAALGVGSGLILFQKERRKNKIKSSIKKQLNSYALISQYVQAIMNAIHWKDGIAPTISSLEKIMADCERDINQWEEAIKKTIAEKSEITEFENRRIDILNMMDLSIS